MARSSQCCGLSFVACHVCEGKWLEGERTKCGALLHGVPYGVPLKILFRMSTVGQCVSSISNIAYLSLNTILNSIVQQYLSLSTHFEKVSFQLLL